MPENQQKRPRHRRRANGESPRHYFDDSKYAPLWQWSLSLPEDDPRRLKVRNEIVLEAQNIAKAIIRIGHMTAFAPEGDLLQEAAVKVLKDFGKFDLNKQKTSKYPAFTYLTTIIKNGLLTYIYRIRRIQGLFQPIDIEYTPGAIGENDFAQKGEDSPEFEHEEDSTTVRSDLHNLVSLLKKERMEIMNSLLMENEIGVEILRYFHSIERRWERDKLDFENLKNLYTLRTLFIHLKKRNYSTQECKNYIRQIKGRYKDIIA